MPKKSKTLIPAPTDKQRQDIFENIEEEMRETFDGAGGWEDYTGWQALIDRADLSDEEKAWAKLKCKFAVLADDEDVIKRKGGKRHA